MKQPLGEDRRRHMRAWPLSVAALVGFGLACGQPVSGPPDTGAPPPTVGAPAPRPTTAGTAPATQDAAGADIIFHNGIILTMDETRPTASAIHIQGEQIASVGSDPAVLAEARPSTVVVDLDGRTLMPGFVDAHSHMFQDPDPAAAQDALVRTGVTTTAEMYVDPPLLQRLIALDAAGDLRLRLSAYLLYNANCGELLDEWWRDYPSTRIPGEMLRIGGVKIFTDGGSCNAPAVTFEYADGVGTGDLYFTQPQLEDALRAIDGAGYQAAVHAIGDRALDVVLGAFENLWRGANPRRHRIEHNAVLRPEQLARYSSAQPVATIFAPFATCHALGGETRFKYQVPDANRTWEWPWRDLIDANPGLHLAWHGDMPIFTTDVFQHLYGFVTRNQVAEDGTICQAPDWLARNALSVDEALQLMTMGAAYALDRENEVGSLTAGKFADLIVLSGNPEAIPPVDLKDLKVLMTMVGGKVEYCAEGMQALCPAAPAAESTAEATSTAFRDDFDSAGLAEGWVWIREDPSAWSLTDRPGWLRLSTGNFSLLRASGDAPLLVHPAPDGDFEILTRLDFAPSANFQFAGLLVYQDDDHFVALGRAFCGVVPPCVGDGVYLDNDEAFLAGDATTIAQAGLPQGEPVWLRLVRQGTNYTGSWSSDGETWTPVGSTMANFIPTNVGLMASTSASGAASASAEFDFFEMTSP